jgi:hypothetical protein
MTIADMIDQIINAHFVSWDEVASCVKLAKLFFSEEEVNYILDQVDKYFGQDQF